jgi:tetratricopeptide (TPR) repeat protein
MVLALATRTSLGQGVPAAGKEPPAKPASAAAPSAKSVVPEAEIRRAIVALGSRDFTVRERASETLWNAGAAAEPALNKVIRESDDFEVVFRARRLLQSFQLGIYADTPPEIVMLIGQFRMGSYQIKQGLIQTFKQKNKTDLLQRLIAREPNADVRAQLEQFASGRVVYAQPSYGVATATVPAAPRVPEATRIARSARLRLATGNFTTAEALLRRGSSDDSARDYAAFLLSQGKLDAEIKTSRDGLAPGNAAGQRRLAWMLRAKGDLAGAVTAAKLASDNDLVEGLLVESADWKELAKLYAKADVDALAAAQNGAQNGPQKLAKIIVFRHLAGEKQACDLAVAAALKALKQSEALDGNLLDALVLSDRVDQCLEICGARHLATAFELRVAQNRMKEAFRLLKIDVPLPAKIDWTAWLKEGKGAVNRERLFLAFQVVRALHLAGENEQARALIAAMLAMVSEKLPENDWETEGLWLLNTEVYVGRGESNDALAAKLLALDLKNPEQVVSALYRDQGPIAALLWNALRNQFPAEDRSAALKHLRRLLTGKPDATAIEELGRLAVRIEPQLAAGKSGDADDDSSDDETGDPRARKLLALATLFHRYGQGKPTMKYLARITPAGVSAQTLIDQGNLYAEEKQWNDAARSYQAAWTKDRSSAAAVYLLGWAQTKLGEEAGGRKRMELAPTIPLGDGESRHDLARTLVRLHQDEEAARQRQWVLRLAPMHHYSIARVLSEITDAAAEKPDAANMAAVWQRFGVEPLLAGSGFGLETRYYLQFSLSAHSARVRELLRANKTAEAIEELHRAEAIQPTYLQLALDCDAELRKHGAAGEADALYRRILEAHEALCRDFPRGGTYHNDLAWLAANLDRDLDKALAHAQRAVELEPQSAGILDTLAEVHFRRGNRSEAVRLAKRCLEMEPDGAHYKKQLARFEAQAAPEKK